MRIRACRSGAARPARRGRQTRRKAEGDNTPTATKITSLTSDSGDRRHQALVALGGIEVAGAEQDREGRHDQRDVKRVGQPGQRIAFAGITMAG
jgi:hypothetical protein